jgi:hypothetical protein
MSKTVLLDEWHLTFRITTSGSPVCPTASSSRWMIRHGSWLSTAPVTNFSRVSQAVTLPSDTPTPTATHHKST